MEISLRGVAGKTVSLYIYAPVTQSLHNRRCQRELPRDSRGSDIRAACQSAINLFESFFSRRQSTDAYIVFSIVSSTAACTRAAPSPLNRASIYNFLISCYLAFADSAFAQPCYRADNKFYFNVNGLRALISATHRSGLCSEMKYRTKD